MYAVKWRGVNPCTLFSDNFAPLCISTLSIISIIIWVCRITWGGEFLDPGLDNRGELDWDLPQSAVQKILNLIQINLYFWSKSTLFFENRIQDWFLRMETNLSECLWVCKDGHPLHSCETTRLLKLHQTYFRLIKNILICKHWNQPHWDRKEEVVLDRPPIWSAHSNETLSPWQGRLEMVWKYSWEVKYTLE